MRTIQKSALFMQQWHEHAHYYRHKAGLEVAERFILAVDEALKMIRENPAMCPLYEVGSGYDALRMHVFRKWNLRGFPYVIVFRIGDNDCHTLFVEVLYAHRMDGRTRFSTDVTPS